MSAAREEGVMLQTLDPWRWCWLLLAVAVFALDQGTKWIVVTEMVYGERIQVLSFFAWVRWHNAGAAFSFLADAGGWQRWFFVAVGLGFSAYIVRELSRLTLQERWMGLVYGLILGGALGNLYGRLVNGYVVDFILVHYERHIFPAFNVADSALFCGVVLWLYLMIQESRRINARELP
jgi:signal peptidase II